MKKVKDKICEKCGFRSNCEGLPGFCLLVPYVAIGAVVIMLIYFMATSDL